MEEIEFQKIRIFPLSAQCQVRENYSQIFFLDFLLATSKAIGDCFLVATWCTETDYQGEQGPEFKREDGSGKVSITGCLNYFKTKTDLQFSVLRTNGSSTTSITIPDLQNAKTAWHKRTMLRGLSKLAVKMWRWQWQNAPRIVSFTRGTVTVTVTSNCRTPALFKCKYATSYENNCPSEYANKCEKLLTTDGMKKEKKKKKMPGRVHSDVYGSTQTTIVNCLFSAVQRDGEKLPMEKIECNLKKGIWTNYANLTMELNRDANVYFESKFMIINAYLWSLWEQRSFQNV